MKLSYFCIRFLFAGKGKGLLGMNAKYQMEINNFIQRFASYQNARIVLYGIGRYTATLLEGLEGFHIVGLMDRDPANIGKKMSGVPIVDKNTAEEIADIVIINTAETYWNVIFDRIKDIRIPVYFINGKRAKNKENKSIKNPFKNLSYSKLLEEIEKAEIVSFDFYDTLFMRSVCSPQDIFRMMSTKFELMFTQMRDRAKKYVRENYSFDELYEQIEKLEGISHEQIEIIKNTEIELEKKLLIPRKRILSLLKDLLEKGREVYIISDMYLSKDFYKNILEKYNILIPDNSILLSNELDANKIDGTLWGYYARNIVNGRAALHIGDNIEADIEKVGVCNIEAYLVPNAWEMFKHSSLNGMAFRICTLYDTCVMGCILGKLFEDPYSLYGTDGMLSIGNHYDMGYCVFGPVIMTFGMWLLRKVKEDGIKKLVFMSRDGYFLKSDIDHICKLLGEDMECCYIGISRQLAMMASIETRQDLMEYAKMPYTGSMTEMFEDRFGIITIECNQNEQIEQYIETHLLEIGNHIAKVRRNYLRYLKKFELDNYCAVVDIGYYGNNQRYLNKLLNAKMAGYYFNANLSDKNENVKRQKMTACFQCSNDDTGENSQILRRQIYLESFLTAPYGMVKSIDEKGNFTCSASMKNQEYFEDKEEMNEGVKQFITDYIDRFGNLEIGLEPEFVDRYYGFCFDGSLEFADEVKNSFYNDNAMMNRIESSLFY